MIRIYGGDSSPPLKGVGFLAETEMKSRECPKESSILGERSKGPSMNTPICDQYIEEQWVSEWRISLQKDLKALKS